jgi:hypothetical protein
MRKLQFALFTLGFALVAIPASATISYSSCSSGCGSTSGSYATLPSESGASGLTFSSEITFSSGGLSGSPALYTDSTTGTVFNAFSNSTAESLWVTGTALVNSDGGSHGSIQLVLPANTYAIAMSVGTNSSSQPWFALVSSPSNLNGGAEQYQLVVPSSSSPQFFGIVSSTPIASLFVWDASGSGASNIQSFEIGQEAPTPESATSLMIGSGLIGLYAWRRRGLSAIRRPLALFRSRASRA